MNITVNRLPTSTWNRLNMNRTTLELEECFDFTPQAACDRAVTWTPKAAWDWDANSHGLSPDLTAFTRKASVALVETKPGQTMDSPLVLTYRYGGEERGMSRLALHAAAGSTLSVVVTAQGGGTSVLQVEVRAEEGAKVELYMVQLTHRDSVVVQEVGGILGDRAEMKLLRLDLGGKRAYWGADLDLLGRESSFSAQMGYYVRPDQLLDMNLVALHHGRDTRSRMEANGTLEEGAKKVFRGTIDFRRGCAGAKGTENENVLLLGESVVNQTIPLILCKEEDVEGDHGATIGQLDQRTLFYLGTRGMDPQAARRLLASSRIWSVCSQIPDEGVRQLVESYDQEENHGTDA